MATEDKQLAMHVRHALARSPLDISELTITSSRGIVELNGKVKKPRSMDADISAQKEFRRAVDLARAVHGVKEVVSERVKIVD